MAERTWVAAYLCEGGVLAVDHVLGLVAGVRRTRHHQLAPCSRVSNILSKPPLLTESSVFPADWPTGTQPVPGTIS